MVAAKRNKRPSQRGSICTHLAEAEIGADRLGATGSLDTLYGPFTAGVDSGLGNWRSDRTGVPRPRKFISRLVRLKVKPSLE